MVSYKELGLVNTREMFEKAMAGKYAIPAFNFNNMEQMQAIIQACVETASPVILQVSSGARKYANQTILRYMAQGAVEYAKELGRNIPICLHLDHGDTFELCTPYLHRTRPGGGFRHQDGCGFPRHLDRHIARGEQVPAGTVHPQCGGCTRTAAPSVRHPRRD